MKYDLMNKGIFTYLAIIGIFWSLTVLLMGLVTNCLLLILFAMIVIGICLSVGFML